MKSNIVSKRWADVIHNVVQRLAAHALRDRVDSRTRLSEYLE